LNWTDNANTFINLTWRIYELHQLTSNNWSWTVNNLVYNTTLVYNHTWYNGTNVSITYPDTLSPYKAYLTEIDLYDEDTGYQEIERHVLWLPDIMEDLEGFGDYATDIKLWVAIITMLLVLLIFSNISIEIGMLFTIILGWIFQYPSIGWLNPINQNSKLWTGTINGVNVYLGGFTLILIFFSVLTVIMLWRKIQKTE